MSTIDSKKISKTIGRALVIIFLVIIRLGCNYGFESTQEPHVNPFDPLYHPTEGRLILGEPKLISEGGTNTIRIPWKEVQSDSILGSDWTYEVYRFEDSEKEIVFSSLMKFGDPSSSMTQIFVTLDPEKDPENRFFEDDTIIDITITYYFVVKFKKSGSSEVNFSNIVMYTKD